MARRSNGGIIGGANLPTSTAAPGTWSLDAVAAQIQGSTRGLLWPGPADPSFSSVTGLYHFRTATSSGYPDSSASNVSATNVMSAGSTAYGLSTTQAKFGQFSFNNNNVGGITLGSGSGGAFGTGDFTIEAWFYFNGVTGTPSLADYRASGSSSITPVIYMTGSKIRYFVNGADRITGGTTLLSNTWYHIALSRVSTSTVLYLAGAQEGSTYSDSNNYINGGAFWGCNFGASSQMSGYIQELRVTKGVGRYSGATLTVPTAPFPDY